MHKRTKDDISWHPEWVLDEAEKFIEEITSDPIAAGLFANIRTTSIVTKIINYLISVHKSTGLLYEAWLYAGIQSYVRLEIYIKANIKVKTIEQDGQIYNI